MNANTWNSAKSVISKLAKAKIAADILGIQELRLKCQQRIREAASWASRQGYKISIAPAEATGETAQQASAGVAVGCKTTCGFTASSPEEFAECPGRLVAGILNIGTPSGLEVVSAYLHDGVGLRAENRSLLQCLGAYLLGQSKPWIVMADWNMTAEELEKDAGQAGCVAA